MELLPKLPPKGGTTDRHYMARFGRIITCEDGGHRFQIIFALAFAAFAGSQTGDEMSLRRADAVAAIAFGRKRVIMRPLRVAVFVEPDAAVARQADFAAIAFDDQLLGNWFAPRGAADSVSVDQTARAAFKIEIDQRVIFALDAWVGAPHPAEDAPELAQQKPERVDEMHDHFVNQQPLHLAEVRLRRVRFGAAPVGIAHHEAGVKRPSDRVLIEQSFDLSVPRLPPPVFVNEQSNVGAGANVDHRHAFFPTRRHRLLTDDTGAAARREADEIQMGAGACDDVYEIGPLTLQHFSGVAIGASDSELFRELFGAPRGRVDHRHYLRAFDTAPSIGLESREAPRADHCAF